MCRFDNFIQNFEIFIYNWSNLSVPQSIHCDNSWWSVNYTLSVGETQKNNIFCCLKASLSMSEFWPQKKTNMFRFVWRWSEGSWRIIYLFNKPLTLLFDYSKNKSPTHHDKQLPEAVPFIVRPVAQIPNIKQEREWNLSTRFQA